MDGLQRDEKHVYSLDGRRLPGVTSIMREVIGGPVYATQFHLDRGSANHACYDLLARGVIDEYDYDIDCQLWIDGWQAWARTYKPVFLASELQVASRVHWYAGTLDAVAEINNALTMVDYKNQAGPQDAIQLAAYALAWEEGHKRKGAIKQLMSVQIAGDGKYKIGPTVTKPSELRQAAADWLAVRRVHRIKTGE